MIRHKSPNGFSQKLIETPLMREIDFKISKSPNEREIDFKNTEFHHNRQTPSKSTLSENAANNRSTISAKGRAFRASAAFPSPTYFAFAVIAHRSSPTARRPGSKRFPTPIATAIEKVKKIHSKCCARSGIESAPGVEKGRSGEDAAFAPPRRVWFALHW
jgi:hypothetical protein